MQSLHSQGTLKEINSQIQAQWIILVSLDPRALMKCFLSRAISEVLEGKSLSEPPQQSEPGCTSSPGTGSLRQDGSVHYSAGNRRLAPFLQLCFNSDNITAETIFWFHWRM